MSRNDATLHLVCGMIAAGKSTLTARLGQEPDTVVIAEDHWLARLYPDAQTCLADYARNAARLRDAMGPHIVSLLSLGVSVVLDFPANTLTNRAWMRTLFEAAGVAHQLHVFDVPDAVCKARLLRRNAEGTHDFTVTEADFDLVSRYVVPPAPEEGFDLVIHWP
ncbi:ATP-binding protein [Methylobacterium sp. GC_Met_2]|uniref:AAA family ATPase n=1 Tax=Methylobacterium sp. GC_Met_2 TaxID=2937376 RepID=UPI00226B47D2|nr:ATP-binding protein [Methylobacterium sp. GC_Met_2]